jgi:hypothetical protein
MWMLFKSAAELEKVIQELWAALPADCCFSFSDTFLLLAPLFYITKDLEQIH